MVRMELKTPLNRFLLIHCTAPILMIGAFDPSGRCRLFSLIRSWQYHLSTRAIFLLYQFMNSDVSRLKQR